jgi:hypothetical protein
VALVISPVLLTSCSSSPTPDSQGPTNTASTVITPAPSAEVIDGVPLVPITSAQRANCVEFADKLMGQVPCPGLLPEPIPVSSASAGASCLGTLGETACGPAEIQVSSIFLLSQSNFQVPPGYVGVTFEQYNGTVVPEDSVDGGPLGHFVFTAGKGGPKLPTYCSPTPVARTIQVHGSDATLYRCSSAPSGPGQLELILGHDLLVWNDAGITTQVSFHGHSQVNVDLDIAVADATVLVSPKKG